MDLRFDPARGVAGELAVPGDKSITHRAYLLAAIAEGTTEVFGANPGADCRATLAAVEDLGVVVVRDAGGDGAGVALTGRPGALVPPAGPLDLGNSGTGMRLLAGLLAGQRVPAMLVGDASLTRRPMAALADALEQLGAVLETNGEERTPPLVLRRTPPLRGAVVRTRGASAQVKSAVLLAALGAPGRTCVQEKRPSRDHTERMLPAFGVALSAEGTGGTGIEGPATPRATTLHVPGDFSAAFFWLVAGTIASTGSLTVRGVGVNPTRTGALAVLARMGARITETARREVGGEPVADLTVEPAPLVASDVTADEVPSLIDELPALAIAQAVARGRSTVAGAADLRHKESDRIEAVVNALRALGGTALETADGWTVEGGALAGGTIDSRGDHRLAMAFGVASLRAEGPVRVLGGEMIDTSYPGFYHAFKDRVQTR